MDWLIVGLAGFFGGMLNAVAGGGSFITLPALIFVGVPPVTANATGTAALLPGYIASVWRFRKDIEFPAKLSLKTVLLVAMIGGCVGAVGLLLGSEQLFSALIPWLILLATLAFVVGPWFLQKRQAVIVAAEPTEPAEQVAGNVSEQASGKSPDQPSEHISDLIPVTMRPISSGIVLLVVCIYGGYFNGGLGIILLAALGLMGQTNLHGMNGVKNVISAVLTSVAVVVYAFGDAIVVGPLLVTGIMAVIGGYVGAVFAYRVSQRALRWFIVLVGFLMSLLFFLGGI